MTATTQMTESVSAESIAARNQTLATLFRDDELIWLVKEEFREFHQLWYVEVVRMGTDGRWMQQRYSYEVVSHVIHFRGAQPVSDDELVLLRKHGLVFTR